jgi:hypothetical protein
MLVYLVFAEVVVFIRIEFLQCLDAFIDLGLCALKDDYGYVFLLITTRHCFTFFFNQFFDLWLLPKDGLKFFGFFVEAEDGANSMVGMCHVFLFPCGVGIVCDLTCPVDIVSKTVLDLILVTSDCLW